MNVNFRSGRGYYRDGMLITVAMLLGVGCTSASGGDPEGQAQNDPLQGSASHTAGSQIRLHEGTASSAGSAGKSSEIKPMVTQTSGCDVSGYQGNVDWGGAAANGATFCYIKATEGTGYTNPYFAQQYNGSYDAGLIRGAYHFARPDVSSGADQANFFVSNGGGWSADGKTLPPALDIEYNPYGDECYGLSAASMVAWVSDFSNTIHALTQRYPTIYTSTDWWTTCAGNDGSFGATNPLWVPRYGSSVGTLPGGWSYQTIWQYADSGALPGDQDYFNGAYDRLQVFAATAD